jgi:hypothetical protein
MDIYSQSVSKKNFISQHSLCHSHVQHTTEGSQCVVAILYNLRGHVTMVTTPNSQLNE